MNIPVKELINTYQASLRSNWESKELDENKLIQEINRETIKHAFKNRHHHKAPMAEYETAKATVKKVLEDNIHPDLASWF